MVESQELAVRADCHSHRVEADRARGGSLVVRIAQPRAREPAHPRTLARAQPRKRLLVGANPPRGGSRAVRPDLARLDLDEY
jgi:hypothetical protein